MYKGSSAAFDAAIKEKKQLVCSKLKITLKDGTVYDLSDNDFIGKSLEVEKSAFPNSVFELGGTVSKTISFSLNNHNKKYDNVSFKDAKVEAWSGLYVDGTPEYVPLGTFWIDSAGKPYDVIEITGVDSILKLEKSYSYSTLTYPATVRQILEEIANKCGVGLSSSNVLNGNITVSKSPDKSNYTFRDILSFVATIAGGFASITRDNQLEIIQISEPDSFITISPDLRVNCKTDYTISITGVAYYGNLQNTLLGTDTYPLILDNNPLIDEMTEADQSLVLNGLYSLYNGFTYTPFECEFIGDPRIDEGDYVLLSNTRDGDIGTYIFNYVFSNGGTEALSAPICDELDKNFLDANKKKESDKDSKLDYAYENAGGGGGPSNNGTYTHNDFPEFDKPIIDIDLSGGAFNNYNVHAKFIDADGNETAQGYRVLVCQYDEEMDTVENVFTYTGGYLRLGQGINTSDYRKGFKYDIKIYTQEEYQRLHNIFNGARDSTMIGNYNIHLWPTLHALSPCRFHADNTGTKFDNYIDITVTDKIVYKDSYFNVREYQMAQFLFYLFRRTLQYSNFEKIVSSPDDLYYLLTAFRVPLDEETGGGGTVEPEPGPEPGEVDKKQLQLLVDKCETLKQEDYTADTWEPFKNDLITAQNVLNSPNATQGDVNAAYKALSNSKNNLQKKPEPEPGPGPEPGKGFEVPIKDINFALYTKNLEKGDVRSEYTYSDGYIIYEYRYMNSDQGYFQYAHYDFQEKDIKDFTETSFTIDAKNYLTTDPNTLNQAINKITFNYDIDNHSILVRFDYSTTDDEQLNAALSETITLKP